MSEKVVIGGSNVTFGLLKDLMRQLEEGSEGKKGLTGDQLRALLEHRNPFDRKEIERVLPFANEEVASLYTYPETFRYRIPEEQLKIWKKHFPDLDASHVLTLAGQPLPEGAKGWGVIPKPSKAGGDYWKALANA